jgi:uncharacterized protein YjcR
MEDVASMSFLAIGRKYGVSDNAIRKWIRWYEYERKQPVTPAEAPRASTPDE